MRREESIIAHFALTNADSPYHDQLIKLFTSADSMVKQVEERLSQLYGTEEQRNNTKKEFDEFSYIQLSVWLVHQFLGFY